MPPVGAIFVPFPPKMGTNMLHPLPPQSLNLSSFFLRNLSVHTFDSLAQGFRPPLARRRSSCPPSSPNLVRQHPIDHYQALRDSLPLACRHPPEGRQIGAQKGRTTGNTILSQPYRRRVSTDRPNREEDNQLAASLGGEPGSTFVGKTLPHSYSETWFRRERARGIILETNIVMKRSSRKT